MLIIIGLGNPGEKFKNTRHNVGFMAIDKFAEKNNFPDFKLNKKYNAEISELGEMLLVKPQTFMNKSGLAVKSVAKNKPVEILLVVHDDIDLPVGKIKIVKDRGSAGHKGVESIIKNIGNDGLIRFRIGIRPASAKASAGEAKKVVLKNFTKEEKEIINQTLEKICDALNLFITDGLEKTMSQFN